jgi:hypothetical protein
MSKNYCYTKKCYFLHFLANKSHFYYFYQNKQVFLEKIEFLAKISQKLKKSAIFQKNLFPLEYTCLPSPGLWRANIAPNCSTWNNLSVKLASFSRRGGECLQAESEWLLDLVINPSIFICLSAK